MRNLQDYRNAKGEIWLNVASSTYVLKDFVNLDNHVFLRTLSLYRRFNAIFPKKYRQRHEEFVAAQKSALLLRHDCRKPLFFPDNSVDHILCSHFLEHVFPDEMEAIIKDFYRVLKAGGTLHVVVPDLQLLAKRYLVKFEQGLPCAADEFVEGTILGTRTKGSFKFRLLEFLGGFGLQHYWMYDYASMAAKLKGVGFSISAANTTPSCQYRMDVDDGSVHVVAVK